MDRHAAPVLEHRLEIGEQRLVLLVTRGEAAGQLDLVEAQADAPAASSCGASGHTPRAPSDLSDVVSNRITATEGCETCLVKRAEPGRALKPDLSGRRGGEVPRDAPAKWASVDHAHGYEAALVVEGDGRATRQGSVRDPERPLREARAARGPLAVEARPVPGRGAHGHEAQQNRTRLRPDYA